MAGNYYAHQRGYGENAESISAEFTLQQDIDEQLQLYGQPFTTPSPPQSQLATSPQPSALHNNHPHFLSPNHTNLPPTRGSLSAFPNFNELVSSPPNPHASNMTTRRTSTQSYSGALDFGNDTNPRFPVQVPSSRSQSLTTPGPLPSLQLSLPEFSPTAITETLLTPLAPPAPHPSTPPRRSAQTRPSERVIGYVLQDKRKFRCANEECHNSTFGRLADLRRHVDSSHGPPNRAEYYCPVKGCQRSRHFGGGGGRSFGTRKDKCEEHIRTVHKNSSERRHAQQYSPVQASGD